MQYVLGEFIPAVGRQVVLVSLLQPISYCCRVSETPQETRISGCFKQSVAEVVMF